MAFRDMNHTKPPQRKCAAGWPPVNRCSDTRPVCIHCDAPRTLLTCLSDTVPSTDWCAQLRMTRRRSFRRMHRCCLNCVYGDRQLTRGYCGCMRVYELIIEMLSWPYVLASLTSWHDLGSHKFINFREFVYRVEDALSSALTCGAPFFAIFERD